MSSRKEAGRSTTRAGRGLGPDRKNQGGAWGGIPPRAPSIWIPIESSADTDDYTRHHPRRQGPGGLQIGNRRASACPYASLPRGIPPPWRGRGRPRCRRTEEHPGEGREDASPSLTGRTRGLLQCSRWTLTATTPTGIMLSISLQTPIRAQRHVLRVQAKRSEANPTPTRPAPLPKPGSTGPIERTRSTLRLPGRHCVSAGRNDHHQVMIVDATTSQH
jgi:hypothetical protein